METVELPCDEALGIVVDGKIHEDDFQRIAEILEQKIALHGKVSLYAEMESFGGMDPESYLQDLKFSLTHWSHFEREAIVTDQKWMEKVAEVADKLFPNIKVRAFPFEEKKQARRWVCGKETESS